MKMPLRTLPVSTWTKLILEHTKCGQGREALRLFKRMQEEEGTIPNNYTIVAALKACSCIEDVEAGKSIHVRIVEGGYDSDLLVANTLVSMYAKCGSIEDARDVFEKMGHRDVVSWNAMMMGYAHLKMGDIALELYARMQSEGLKPDARTFVAALKACACSAAADEEEKGNGVISYVEQGRAIHAELAKRGFEPDIFVASTLVDMYVKHRNIKDACQVFENMPYRNVVSWNTMIMGYAQMEMGESALGLYVRMKHEGFTPNARTFIATLKACANLAAQKGKETDGKVLKTCYLQQGRLIHAEIVKGGFESDIFVASTLVDMYAKCGSIEDARKVFENMSYRNVVSWSAMIVGYAQMEMGNSALELYARMQHEGFTPNARTFVAAVKACGSLVAEGGGQGVKGELLKTSYLVQGKAIHAELAGRGFESDIYIANTLVDMYGKCGNIDGARQVFESMKYRDVVSWNAMIIGYAQMGIGITALELYACMQHEGFIPNDRTFVAALKACCNLAQEGSKEINSDFLKAGFMQGRAIHSELTKRGFESCIYVANALVDMYAKCGSIEDARQVFEKMWHHDVVSWNAMITGYAQLEMGAWALELYLCMQYEGFTPDGCTFLAAVKACSSMAAQEEDRGEGKPMTRSYQQGKSVHAELAKRGFESDIYIANALVDMYGKCGSMEDACQVFENMKYHDVVSWNAIISGYLQMQRSDLSLDYYACMQHQGFKPDAHTFSAVLKACGNLASLETGKEIHFQIHKAGLEADRFVANCLIDMYSKCGNMVDARQLFDSMLVRDSVTWNSLLAGYCDQGKCESLYDLYKKMQLDGINPDTITFVTILTFCSHNGLVDKGQIYFQAMCLEHGISPSNKHYMCMADLLGRAGQLDEAVVMLKMMPFKSDIVTWMIILDACRKWSSVEIGRVAFECAVTLDEKFAAAYLLMIDIYVSAQMWVESAIIQERRMNVQVQA